MIEAMNSKWLLIWDGDCGFCQASAAWILAHDRTKTIESITSQRCPRPPMTDELFTRSTYEVLLLDPKGRVLGGADAVFAVLGRSKWGFFAKVLGAPPLIWIMRWGYKIVARNRGWISQKFMGGQSCSLPPAKPKD